MPEYTDISHQKLEHYISTSKECDLHSGGDTCSMTQDGSSTENINIELSFEISPNNNNNNNNELYVSGLVM